jgi:hypothetical protein
VYNNDVTVYNNSICGLSCKTLKLPGFSVFYKTYCGKIYATRESVHYMHFLYSSSNFCLHGSGGTDVKKTYIFQIQIICFFGSGSVLWSAFLS